MRKRNGGALIAATVGAVVWGCLGVVAHGQEKPWLAADVPAVWKKGTGDGVTWFRAAVVVPESWRGAKLELFLEPVDDAREAFLNGVRIGGAGEFPPRYRSGLGSPERHTIDARHVKFGEPNALAIRIYRKDGRTGFNVAPPVLFGGREAIRLQGVWGQRAGDDAAWASGPTPAVAATFDRREPADAVVATLKKLDGEEGPLTPAESLARFKTPDDLQVELALSEPEIGQPLSLKFDARGRLWVLNYRQYPNPAGLTMVSRDQHLRTVYDRTPPAPPHHFRGQDRITFHEDTDGDGRYDRHGTFVDGLSLATSFAFARDGVWVLNPPYLLFYPDADQDDVPDGDPVVHLEGFGIEDSHSIANSLRWGSDGWLYGGQGSTVTGQIRRPGEKSVVHSMGQLIWRYHPERRQYEVFAEGGGNTFGVEIDAAGRVFSGHNGGDTRGFHYVPGGYSQKGFGKHGALSNPFAFGYFPQMAHDKVPRFTHTFVIYEADALSGTYERKLFGVAPLQSHVVLSEVQPHGSTFRTRDTGHALTSTDPWFRPVDIQLGPDGAVYVADFHEQRIDHASHYQGRVRPDTGRVWRLKAKGAPLAPRLDLRKLSSDELVDFFSHKNRTVRQTALRLIGERREATLVPRLQRTLAERPGQEALEALWALHRVGGLTDDAVPGLLRHENPHVQAWTIRLACDGRSRPLTPGLVRLFADHAAATPHVVVRSQLASTARRLPPDVCLAIVRGLVTHADDVADPHVPLLLWWALETQCGADPAAVVAWYREPAVWDLPLVRQHLVERTMRRFALSGKRTDLLWCAKLLEQAPTPEHARRLMTGFEQAYEGRPLTNLPDALVAAIAKAGGTSLALRVRHGDLEAVSQALALIGDDKADRKQRLQLAQVFGQVKTPQCVAPLLTVVQRSADGEVRSAALAALQSYDDAAIAPAVIAQHDALPDDTRLVAQTLLSSRPSWSVAFLEAIAAERVKRTLVTLPIVRKLLLHADPRIGPLVQRTFGDVAGATTEQMREQVERYAALIGSGSGNPYSGKQIYRASCGKCHRLFEDGGLIGPDLTAYKRDDLKRLLLSVVNPSAEIREGFENYVVQLDDGRTLNGFIADQDNQVLVLKGIDGQSTVVNREQIEDQRAIARSLMPDGILATFGEQQVRDLFAYLRATQPLP